MICHLTCILLLLQAEADPSGKFAGKTFVIPLEETFKPTRVMRSPSPSKNTSDKKAKKHKKHKSKGKDRHKDKAGADAAEGEDDGDSSDDATPNDRATDSVVTKAALQDTGIVHQVVRVKEGTGSRHRARKQPAQK